MVADREQVEIHIEYEIQYFSNSGHTRLCIETMSLYTQSCVFVVPCQIRAHLGANNKSMRHMNTNAVIQVTVRDLGLTFSVQCSRVTWCVPCDRSLPFPLKQSPT